MKRVLLFLSLIMLSQTASAQLFSKKKIQNNQNVDKGKYSWGYFLGFNSYDFNFDYKQDLKDIQTTKTLGFSVGLIGNMRINEYLDLRLEPGLFISARDLVYDESYFSFYITADIHCLGFIRNIPAFVNNRKRRV